MSLSKENIMHHTNNGLDIFRHYIPERFTPGKSIKSPLREDKHPSFSIFMDSVSGIYLFKDHARDEVKGDAIRFVELLYNISFKDALNKINAEIGLNLIDVVNQEKKDEPETIKKEITVELKESRNNDFWLKYKITPEILDRYNVKEVDIMKVPSKNNGVSLIKSESHTPIYVYQFPWGFKVYNPLGTQRFLYIGRKPENYIFGFDQLPNTGLILFITGGEKDVLTLTGLGFNAISFNSETANIDEKTINLLKNRFKYIIVLFDNDNTGIKSSSVLSNKYNLQRILLPKKSNISCKDISDFVADGLIKKELEFLIDKAIEHKFDETLKILSPFTFSEKNEVKRPIPVLTIDDNNILSNGNILVLAGKVKTGKSAVLYSIIAGAIQNILTSVDTLGISVSVNTTKNAVLHFDTEQSDYDLHHRLMSTLRRANLDKRPDFFQSYHILEFTLWERLKYIEEMMEFNYLKHGGIHIVLVDGVADLVQSVNDEEKSNKVVDLFHRLASEYNCPIVLVVHLNPDGMKTRGHLGSQLDRKAESVIIIEREGDVCTINPKYCRNANALDISLKQFKWDNDKNLHVFTGQKTEADKIEQKIDEYQDILDEIFKDGCIELPKSNFKDQLGTSLGIERSSTYTAINFMFKRIPSATGILPVN